MTKLNFCSDKLLRVLCECTEIIKWTKRCVTFAKVKDRYLNEKLLRNCILYTVKKTKGTQKNQS